MRRDVFQAIADPTRRQIVTLLSSGSLNLNAIADNFDVSRPAVSKHIRILTECGLVTIRSQGRERFCEANLQSLQEVDDWVKPFRIMWTAKLDALGEYLAKEEAQEKKKAKKTVSAKHKTKKK